MEMAENRAVPTAGRNFVGIGKFLFDTVNAEWNIPHLHFLVDKTKNDVFEAINLEFGLVSSGKNPIEAVERLASLSHFHITSVMTEGKGYAEFIESAKTRDLDDFWAAYREIDFVLGAKGKDLSHAIERQITRAIQGMIDEQIKKIITQKAEKKADEIIKEYMEATTVILKDVEYTELKGAA
jgi:hypothetical protein